MLRENKELYEFDKFRLDVSERFLLKSGKRVALADRAFDTLCVLVRHGNQLIGKDELMTEVWADAIVEENNLDKNISALRQILGERNGKQKFIETVRGHGYRFVAEVRRIENSKDVEHSEPPAPMNGLDLSEPPAAAGELLQVKNQESKVERQSESQISNLKFQNENQSPKTVETTDRRENPKSQIPNRTSLRSPPGDAKPTRKLQSPMICPKRFPKNNRQLSKRRQPSRQAQRSMAETQPYRRI